MAQPRRQLSRIERFRQVVIRADFETDDAIQIVAASGQHHHRDGRPGAKLPQQVESEQVGQHHIDKHHVIGAVHRTIEPGGGVMNRVDAEALGLEVLLHQRTELHVVVDQQHGVHDVVKKS